VTRHVSFFIPPTSNCCPLLISHENPSRKDGPDKRRRTTIKILIKQSLLIASPIGRGARTQDHLEHSDIVACKLLKRHGRNRRECEFFFPLICFSRARGGGPMRIILVKRYTSSQQRPGRGLASAAAEGGCRCRDEGESEGNWPCCI
jgi:hypothetical protein